MPKWTNELISQAQSLYKSGLSMQEVGQNMGVSVWSIRSLARRYKFTTRKSSETNKIQFLKSPLSFHPKNDLTNKDSKLKVAGLMLYWGEGAKKNAHGIDFANSDQRMIKVFMRFLRTIYSPCEARFRILLYTYHSENLLSQIQYWSSITSIPLNQFSKPYVRSQSNQKHDKMPHGLVHIRYHDKRLFQRLMSDLEELISRWDDGVDKRASL